MQREEYSDRSKLAASAPRLDHVLARLKRLHGPLRPRGLSRGIVGVAQDGSAVAFELCLLGYSYGTNEIFVRVTGTLPSLSRSSEAPVPVSQFTPRKDRPAKAKFSFLSVAPVSTYVACVSSIP